MAPENDRPQDVGRRHTRKRSEGKDTALIERWHAELRVILDRVIVQLRGEPQPDGLHGAVPPKLPSTAQTIQLVDLGAKVAKELGSALDPQPTGTVDSARRAPRPRKGITY